MNLTHYTNSNKEILKGLKPLNCLEFLYENPFSYKDAPILLQMEDEGECVGSVYAFPLQLCYKNGEVFTACAGSTLEVKQGFRGLGLAKKMTLQRLELTKDRIAIASGLSNMSLPLFRKLGFSVFISKRNIYLKNSRPIVEMLFKESLLLRVFTNLLNCFLGILKMFLSFQRFLLFRGLSIEEVEDVPTEIEEIICMDPSIFRENHDRDWFKWILKGGFVLDDRSKQHLFVVKNKNEIIGFYMTKERFHKQASHRGFKNVILGSVIEWGVKPGISLKEEHLILDAILSFGSHVDAVEVCSTNEKINKFLKNRFIIGVGESNFAVKAHENSPMALLPEYKEQFNWRIRPAASDNSFN